MTCSPRSKRLLLCALMCGVAAACVDDRKPSAGKKDKADAATGDAATHDSQPLLPWAVGNRWTYRVTGDGVVTMKETTIGAEEIVGGSGPHKAEMAYKVVTEKADGTDKTISWQIDLGGRVLRYREQSYAVKSGQVNLEEHWDPSKLHIDGTNAHTAASATWLEAYTETKIPTGAATTTSEEHDRWTVESVRESVTVPAGTFDDAILITKAGGSSTKSYWYVRGIGKLKETGGQTEELVSYELGE